MDHTMMRKIQRKRNGLNRANKIEMLRRGRKGPDLQAADRQKNAFSFTPERSGRRRPMSATSIQWSPGCAAHAAGATKQ